MSNSRYEEIISQLNDYNHHYYTLDKPIISDQEYDRLYDELITMEKANPNLVTNHSPSQRVGGDVLSLFKKKKHTTLLYSLDKAQTYEELRKFFVDVLKAVGKGPIRFTMEQKMDGLALILRYENGKYVEARTRGNGKIGEIITEQARTIKSIPLTIPFLGTLEVQGEVFMPNHQFVLLNEQIEKEYRTKTNNFGDLSDVDIAALKELKFKNARNATGGSLRNLDPKVTASRKLDVYLYNVPFIEGKQFSSQSEMMNFLGTNGFKVNPYFHLFETVEEAISLIDEMVLIRPTLNYDIDGTVVKVDSAVARDTLGFTSKYPKWAIAWKFEAEQTETILRSVVIETGRTGKIAPVGLLEPVELGGVTVKRATLNNYEWIEEQGLKFSLGATVIVRRSNDVIPEILGLTGDDVGTELVIPTHCPSCSSLLEKNGAHLFCTQYDTCPAQQIGKITHFGSRDAMNIDSFSDKTAEQLWHAGLLTNIVDLYRLKVEDLLPLDRFDVKKATKLIEAIKSSKDRPLEAFLFGLGIRNVGKGTVERLLRYYDSIEKISQASITDLMEIEDIGEAVAESIYVFFHDSSNKEKMEELQSLGVLMQHEIPETAGNSLTDMVFVVTGTMPSGKNRTEIETLIKSNGGKTSKSVSTKTTYVVAGDEAGSKLTKAEALEAKTGRKIVLTEDEFLALI